MKLITNQFNQPVNPYSYNAVAEKARLKRAESKVTGTMNEIISNPLYNTIGHFLGINNKAEWGENYDKVERIIDHAVRTTGTREPLKILEYVKTLYNESPGFNDKKITDVCLMANLKEQGLIKNENNS